MKQRLTFVTALKQTVIFVAGTEGCIYSQIQLKDKLLKKDKLPTK